MVNLKLEAMGSDTSGDFEKRVKRLDSEAKKKGATIPNLLAPAFYDVRSIDHEMMTTTDKPIAKGIEANFEAFREEYNDFMKDTIEFCHKMNEESESCGFPEHSFEYLKKW